MQDCINLVKKELQTTYPDTEIRSFINLIFGHLFSYSPSQLYINQNQAVSTNNYEKLATITEGLKKYRPIQYLLGETEFYGLKFKIGPAVLIPRPETEELVQWIIESFRDGNPTILDIGTGSGCIAVSLAKFIQGSKVFALDVSTYALEIAQKNARLNKTTVSFYVDDILKPQTKINLPLFDCIVSNPPYVKEQEKELMQKNVLDNEPHLALFVPDNDALVFYHAICNFAKQHLKKGGWLYFEINEQLGESAVELMQTKGFSNVELKKDLFDKDRMVRGSWKI
ncbi:MAG: peptide chain release factor N(5)-glutamine methyltransferase [Bacteroidales bacterium]|nr:peptide chain release factor N(5)-glutamine methyltransferase [Bacteroidales bacterium]MCF8455260.1 peptide chain release factor N(5)-glutamine methyltransferase [Bacteroidales bacterium]